MLKKIQELKEQEQRLEDEKRITQASLEQLRSTLTLPDKPKVSALTLS